MTEDQAPVAVLIVALSGGVAGIFAWRSWRAGFVALLVILPLNVLGCAAYGYTANIQRGATYTFSQMFAGFLIALPGTLIFLGIPTFAAWLLSAMLSRVVRAITTKTGVG